MLQNSFFKLLRKTQFFKLIFPKKKLKNFFLKTKTKLLFENKKYKISKKVFMAANFENIQNSKQKKKIKSLKN